MVEGMCIENYKTTVGYLNKKIKYAIKIALIALSTQIIDANMKS